MAFDEDPDDERPRTDPPPPPDDRLWRHPSEVAGGSPLPAAWPEPRPSRPPRRGMALAALGSACLAGATVAMGIMWVTRPTRIVIHEVQSATTRPVTAVYSPAGIPTETLAKQLSPKLVQVAAAHDDLWTTGTGVWLDGQGTIVVAAPLVTGAANVMVTTRVGHRVRATLVGTDPATGIAVLRLSHAAGSPVVQPTVSPLTGQPVAVISAPSSATEGASQQRIIRASISAVGVRTTVGSMVLHNALQLDRAIPSDALGSVVVDANGRLLGIVLAASGTDHLAVVVPAHDALAAARGLRGHGTVRRAWLGVRTVDLSPAASLLLAVPGGALLTSVEKGSPASKAGLVTGDVITEVDGHTISDASDLVVSLRTWAPGEHVVITWHRGPATREAEVNLGG